MKTKLLLLFLTIATITNAQNWLWASRAGGKQNDVGNSICSDLHNNVFVTGYFDSKTITFGTYKLTNHDTVDFSGTKDIYLVKYNSAGQVKWAQSFGGTGYYNDAANSVCTDSLGNVYITGYFEGDTITFGKDTLFNDTTDHAPDIFSVKFDSLGNVIWARRAGGTNYDYATGISVDGIGNVYITGYFYSTKIKFGSYTIINSDKTGNTSDVFVAKYNSSGTPIWATSAGNTGYDGGNCISVDKHGNSYITGYFECKTITFGTTVLTNANNAGTTYDIFIVKYDSAGKVKWAKGSGGANQDEGYGITVDSNGRNIYVTGSFYNTIKFGADSLVNSWTCCPDIFLVKYDSAGNEKWVAGTDGGGTEVATSVSTHGNNVYIGGYFNTYSLTIGATTLINNSPGYGDILIADFYTVNGIPQWAESVNGSKSIHDYEDDCLGVTTDVSGNVYLTGFFQSTSILIGSTTLTNNYAANFDIFVTKADNSFPTGIQETPLKTIETSVLPNPSNGKFTITTQELQPDASVIIYNILGSAIYKSKVTSTSTDIDLSRQAPGIYLYRILTQKGEPIGNGKIVVE